MNKLKSLVRLAKLLGVSVREINTKAKRQRLIPLIRLDSSFKRARLAPARRKHIAPQPAILQSASEKRLMTLKVQPDLDENQLYDGWQNAPDEDKWQWEQQLYRSVSKHAKALVLRMLGEDDPDLTHDIASAAVLQLPSFEQKSKFSTYVHGIAKKKVLEKQRQLARYNERFVAYEDLKTEKPLAVDPCDPSPSIRPLIQLPEDLNQQERLLLKTMSQNGSIADIAKGLGITINAAESRWRRLKKKLEKAAWNDGERGLSATKLTEAPGIHRSRRSTPRFLYVGCSPELYAAIMAKERESLYCFMTREELEKLSDVCWSGTFLSLGTSSPRELISRTRQKTSRMRRKRGDLGN